MALGRDLYLSHELPCLPGISPKLRKRMPDSGELCRSEGDGPTAFPAARLADETAVPFCKRKGKSKIPLCTLVFFFPERRSTRI